MTFQKIAERLEVDKAGNILFLCEASRALLFVLDHATLQVIADTGGENTGGVGENVGVVDSRF